MRNGCGAEQSHVVRPTDPRYGQHDVGDQRAVGKHDPFGAASSTTRVCKPNDVFGMPLRAQFADRKSASLLPEVIETVAPVMAEPVSHTRTFFSKRRNACDVLAIH